MEDGPTCASISVRKRHETLDHPVVDAGGLDFSFGWPKLPIYISVGNTRSRAVGLERALERTNEQSAEQHLGLSPSAAKAVAGNDLKSHGRVFIYAQ